LLELFLNPQVEQRFRRHAAASCGVVYLAPEVSQPKRVDRLRATDFFAFWHFQ
jgi:hypothetical protein